MSKSSKKSPVADRNKTGARNLARDTSGPEAGRDGKARPSIDVRAIAAGELEIEPCPRVEQGFRVFISEDAFDRAVERGQKDTTREIGGVLVGVVRRDDAGPYVRVDTTIDALHAEEKGAELTFTHDTWQHIHEQMDSVHQGKRVVGWYHTHPGFGIFLSDRDQFIHHSFFDLPFQVAMVYDPRSREHGVFTWHEGNLQRGRRYWIGAHEHTWDGAHQAAAAEDEARQDTRQLDDQRPRSGSTSSHSDRDRETSHFDWFAMGLLGLVLILVAGWLGHCYGKEQVVQQATVEIARAQAIGAQQAVQSINVELVETVRAALDKESTRRRVQDIVDALDRALVALDSKGATGSPRDDTGDQADDQPDNQPDDQAGGAGQGDAQPAGSKDAAGKAEIKRARRAALDLLAEQRNLAAILATFRDGARAGNTAEARAIIMQQNALGTLYSELARDLVKQGDTQRAARYLQTAALIDPGGFDRYQKQLNEFDKGAKLTAPSPSAPRQKALDKAPDKAGPGKTSTR